jgi:hypothetical protein
MVQAPKPVDGDGFARGCRRPGSFAIGIPGIAKKEVGGVVPSWVQATSRPNVQDHRNLPQTVEGVLVESRITKTDFPLRPWHAYYDWNFFVRPDRKYTGLLSVANVKDRDHPGLLECEWDTAFLPDWAWPQKGGRIWIVGRWIYDCGHPGQHGHKTEIHPPKAVASFRSEAVKLPGNPGATRANVAVLYIGRRGGYWTAPINDMNYEFLLPLPPKPFPGAVPRFTVVAKTGALPVRPVIAPMPPTQPRALKVTVPLKNVAPHPIRYGAFVAGGWSDPRGVESRKVIRLEVAVQDIVVARGLFSRPNLFLYIGVNGRWRVFEKVRSTKKNVRFTVTLALHPSDRVHVTAFGFDAQRSPLDGQADEGSLQGSERTAVERSGEGRGEGHPRQVPRPARGARGESGDRRDLAIAPCQRPRSVRCSVVGQGLSDQVSS